MITAQFCINGNAKQTDISRAFGITLISVKRAVKRSGLQIPLKPYRSGVEDNFDLGARL